MPVISLYPTSMFVTSVIKPNSVGIVPVIPWFIKSIVVDVGSSPGNRSSEKGHGEPNELPVVRYHPSTLDDSA